MANHTGIRTAVGHEGDWAGGCFEPGPPLEGAVEVPGSKSIAQRAILAAAFAPDAALLTGDLGQGGDELGRGGGPGDVGAALAVAQAFGARVQPAFGSRPLELHPGEGPVGGDLRCGESGTTARLGLGLSALAAPAGTRFRLVPEGTLRGRSSAALVESLRAAGLAAVPVGSAALDLEFESLGPAAGRELELHEPASSQEVSALLMGLAAGGGGTLLVHGAIPSEPYVHLTRSVLAKLGVEVGFDTIRRGRRYRVPGGGLFTGGTLKVPADASSGAVGLVALSLTDGRGHVPGLTRDSGQPDVQVAECLAEMGVAVEVASGTIRIAGRPEHGADLNFTFCPDLAPAIAAAAAAVALRVPGEAGASRLTGLETLPGKESSRIEVLGRGLRALGLQADWDARSLEIRQGPHPPHGDTVELEACGDHRMVFAFALLSLVRPGIRVLDRHAVAKSWPRFFHALESLGARRVSD